jgi:hypothetical protein
MNFGTTNYTPDTPQPSASHAPASQGQDLDPQQFQPDPQDVPQTAPDILYSGEQSSAQEPPADHTINIEKENVHVPPPPTFFDYFLAALGLVRASRARAR